MECCYESIFMMDFMQLVLFGLDLALYNLDFAVEAGASTTKSWACSHYLL
jgi:hypothetical protein